ncbi:MAG: DUF1553 domain-containing protein, partial [Planctomycetaceae bacterium]|nr:DUF1553 domain-containing protein [Planctomycetaceae bacterium]
GRDWWSFQPLKVVVPPASINGPGTGSENAVDRFIRAKLYEKQLTPAPPASAEVLLRRLTWDLTGLPPQGVPADLKAPGDSKSFSELVDQLLAMPQFGERWGRHWLDVVRFAESSGYERDQPKPFAWKYRDWVVRAFNENMPYDQFIIRQLAGDELPNRTEQDLIATGFLRLGTWNDEPNDPEDYKYERLEDLVNATSSAFLGLTTKCARCHDHKFDPIPQSDYYRMAAAFWPGPIEPRGRELLGGPTPDELGASDILGWTDITRSPAPLHVLKSGERAHPMQAVGAGPLSCISDSTHLADFTVANEPQKTTGLRTELAHWITGPANPLTARVMVNRIWLYHFGEGLVRTANNFGFTGDQPTHPELLDWLANELIQSGWDLKHIHRLILNSETWKQASIHPKESLYRQVDSANHFWWRANRRRVDAESLRDAFLASTGELDLKLGGPSFFPSVSEEALEGLSRKASAWTASSAEEQRRRSLYIFSQRSLLPPMMTAFDFCDTTLPCGQRDVTIVAPQALTLLNNDFAHARAAAMADRVVASSEGEADRIRKLWKSVLNREPRAEELKLAVTYLNAQAKQLHTESKPEEVGSGKMKLDPNIAWLTPVVDAIQDSSVAGVTLPETCRLFLDARAGMEVDSQGNVASWKDQSPHQNHAAQSQLLRAPRRNEQGIAGQPSVTFNGTSSYMNLAGQVLPHDECTVLAVVTDEGAAGHRELLSNWSGRDGNSGTSFFVGLTNESAIRLSDAISGVGEIRNRKEPFILTATNGEAGAAVFQQSRQVAGQTNPLPVRRLETPWVIGQQGNIDGEYWKGQLALLIVLDKQLTPAERDLLWQVIAERFEIPLETAAEQVPRTPEQLAWASLALVLFNSNEFAFVD